VLIGLPGSGKSTVARRLAKIYSVPVADTDELVEAATGRTVPELFETAGEPAFRAAESTALQSALTDFDGVLSLGGGAILAADNRSALVASGAPIVLLRGEPATLLARLGDPQSRPLLRADPAARLAALAAEREPLYRSVATLTVDTDHHTPAQVAATIAARLHERERVDG
jgi:shikimate kinase